MLFDAHNGQYCYGALSCRVSSRCFIVDDKNNNISVQLLSWPWPILISLEQFTSHKKFRNKFDADEFKLNVITSRLSYDTNISHFSETKCPTDVSSTNIYFTIYTPKTE